MEFREILWSILFWSFVGVVINGIFTMGYAISGGLLFLNLRHYTRYIFPVFIISLVIYWLKYLGNPYASCPRCKSSVNVKKFKNINKK